MEGFLWKKGEGRLAGYKRRWFRLDGSLIHYYDDQSERKELGTIDVSRALRVSRGDVTRHKKRAVASFAGNVFEIEVPGRTFILIPERDEELRAWIGHLGTCVEPSCIRGDLRRIADAFDGDDADDADGDPEAHRKSPARRGKRSPVAKPPAARPRGESDEEEGPVVMGNGRSGGGGGFFSRAAPSPAPIDDSRLKSLEEGYSKTQSEVVRLKQELATLRSADKAVEKQPRSGKGGKGKGKSLLSDYDHSDDGGAGRGGGDYDDDDDDDDDEVEVLPGCGCCGGRCTCKVFFIVVVNIVVIATGIVVGSAGGYALAKQAQFKALLSSVAAGVLLGVGLGFVAMGALGSFAATRFTKARGKCLLLIYVIFMTALTLGELGGSVFLIIDVENVKVPAAGAGAASAAEKQIETFLDDVYRTCCNASHTQPARTSDTCVWLPDTVLEGCPLVKQHVFEDRVASLIRSELGAIGGAAAGLVVVHAAAVWFSLTLICPCCSCGCLFFCCRRKKADGGDDDDDDDDDDGRGQRGRSRSRSRARSKSRSRGSDKERRQRRKASMYDDFDD